MREIKFRAWDPFNKIMWGTDKCYLGDRSTFFREYEDAVKGENEPILMQYTGLKDRHGAEIYEGDVVKGNGEQGLMGYSHIHFNEHAACWGLVAWNHSFTPLFSYHVQNTTDSGGLVCSKMTKMEECEVIGNIYENKELLDERD